MATLVLNAAGAALGGPIGGALGALVGQAIDQQLFGAGPRKGPRLGDLSIQTASYGTMIPRVYGRMRVAGSVVWATELKESETAVSGGKGASDALVYAYSASFAVALSSRPAVRIGRIWADGKLLRGAAGDLKVAGSLRFHDGGVGQSADPLIAAIEGPAGATSFPGLAVAVFEDLALADYGNRIPMLTFEVIADEAAPTVGAILADATGGVIDSGAAVTLDGYAAHGADRRSAVASLVDLMGVRLADDGEGLSDRDEVARGASGDQLGCADKVGGSARLVRARTPLSELPHTLSLAYYDPARDYQAGLAHAGGAAGQRSQAGDVAVAVSADGARRLAEDRLAARWAERERVTVALPPAFLNLRVGDALTVPGLAGAWQVTDVEVKAMAVSARIVRQTGRSAALPADAGRARSGADAVSAPTRLLLLDLPDLGTNVGGPTLAVAAGSAGAWRPVTVSVTANGVERPTLLIQRASIIGTTVGALAAGASVIEDDVSFVVVELLDSEGWLVGCDRDALAMGRNLALIGDELVQFGRVDPVSGGRFRLSALLRGRRGTEWAIGAHVASETFVMIDPARQSSMVLPDEMIGAEVAVLPHGLADGAATATQRTASGENLRPPSPCQLRLALGAGGLTVEWVRRSRLGWGWSDGADAPLGEAVEAYRVRLSSAAASNEWQSATPGLTIAAAELVAFGSGELTVAVAQLGDRLASRDAIATINL